ncbi:hypothetical protein ACYSTU_24140 [Pseudomonas glycinis]
MTPKATNLAPPQLLEATVHDGKLKLYIHNLVDPAHGIVESYPDVMEGDKVIFEVSTSTGNQDKQELEVKSPTDASFVFNIAKKIFAEKFEPGAIATLSYSVQRSGNTAPSEKQKVYLEL